jgi:hypothetical protein
MGKPIVVALAVLALTSARCGGAAGAPCTTKDSSFFARSGCATQCLDVRSIVCPSGERVSPHICAGEKSCAVGGCPSGQACYHIDDPFEVEAYCVPASVCPDLPGDAAALRAWETAAEQRAAEQRERYRPKGARTPTETPKGDAP